MKKYDFVILGGGPAGVSAALLASRFHRKVALIEVDKAGGISLHHGCTPTKSMLVSARYLRRLHHSSDFGVHTSEIHPSLSDFLNRQRNVVSKCYQVLLEDLRQANISIHHGSGKFIEPFKLEITQGNSSEIIEGSKIIIATGARPKPIPGIPYDGEVFFSSSNFLTLADLPPRLLMIGGGYIQSELACIYSALGSKVTIIEQKDEILGAFDPIVGKTMHNIFTRYGVDVRTNANVVRGTRTGSTGEVELADGSIIAADKIFISTGRVPALENFAIEKSGIKYSDRIEVDNRLETSVPGIFAVGDVNGLILQSHSAIIQGRMAALNAMGEDMRFQPQNIPVAIYTTPEIASVGWSEPAARQAGFDVITSQIPFTTVARPLALGELTGFVKLVADRGSGRLIGAVILGGQAAEMIGQITTAINMGATIQQLSHISSPHPTHAEAMQEAIWDLMLQTRNL